MTKAQMTAFLNTTGIPVNEWINGGKLGLYSINLDSDGNEIISDTNKYYFDLDRELILVKEYFYKKDVGRTYVLSAVSNNNADYFLAFYNISGIKIGNAIKQKPDPFISYLYTSAGR